MVPTQETLLHHRDSDTTGDNSTAVTSTAGSGTEQRGEDYIRRLRRGRKEKEKKEKEKEQSSIKEELELLHYTNNIASFN